MPAETPYLIVATPAFGGQVMGHYISSVLKLQLACRQKKIRFNVILQEGDALIPRARQDLMARFLAQHGSTHLLYVDADIGFEPDQVFRLLDFGEDCTAAAYPLKWLDTAQVRAKAREGKDIPDAGVLTYVYEPEEPAKRAEKGGFMKVRFAGNGFLMLKRQAIQSMMDHYPQLKISGTFTAQDQLAGNPYRYALFNCMIDPKSGEYLSEDWSFCQRWQEMGGEIWVDQQSRLQHMGPTLFKGDLSARLGQGPDSVSE